MYLTIDANDRRPIYQQIADGIRTLIASRELSEGTALPPVRQLAGDLGVNLNTIAAAYRELQSEGLLAVKHGSGAVVASRTTERDPDELLRSLRNVLAQFVLTGLPEKKILSMIMVELHALMKVAR
jgi:GntR family transcriptional regulator